METILAASTESRIYNQPGAPYFWISPVLDFTRTGFHRCGWYLLECRNGFRGVEARRKHHQAHPRRSGHSPGNERCHAARDAGRSAGGNAANLVGAHGPWHRSDRTSIAGVYDRLNARRDRRGPPLDWRANYAVVCDGSRCIGRLLSDRALGCLQSEPAFRAAAGTGVVGRRSASD